MNVAVGIVTVFVPPMVLPLPENVCTPVLAVYVLLLVRFPAMPTMAAPFSVNVPLIVTSEPNESVAAADSDRVAPLLIVTAPVNVLVPVALVMDKIPLAPLPIVDVPVTVHAKPPATDKVVPSLT